VKIYSVRKRKLYDNEDLIVQTDITIIIFFRFRKAQP